MSLDLIIGCMYSGKSTELIRRVNRLKNINKSYIIFNSNLDIRYSLNDVCTHNQEKVNCKMVNKLLPELNLTELKDVNTIFIDEAQFFIDLYEFVKLAVETFHKNVVVIGLDGDSNRSNFGEIHKLIPICDNIIKLKALCSICNDGTAGIFSKKMISSDNQVDVGSTDKYIAVCRVCYLK